CDSIQQFSCARERHQHVNKAEAIERQRDPQTDHWHVEADIRRKAAVTLIISALGYYPALKRCWFSSPHALRLRRSDARVDRIDLVYPFGFLASRFRCVFFTRRGPNSSGRMPSIGNRVARRFTLSKASSGNSLTSTNSS